MLNQWWSGLKYINVILYTAVRSIMLIECAAAGSIQHFLQWKWELYKRLILISGRNNSNRLSISFWHIEQIYLLLKKYSFGFNLIECKAARSIQHFLRWKWENISCNQIEPQFEHIFSHFKEIYLLLKKYNCGVNLINFLLIARPPGHSNAFFNESENCTKYWL